MAKKLGNQNPTQKKVNKYRKSEYKKAIELYEKSGNKVQKWQELLLKDIMALNSDKLWVHSKFGFAVPRRNGDRKSVV